MRAARAGQLWTPEDEELLLNMLSGNKSLNDICNELGRTSAGVLSRMEIIARNRTMFCNLRKQILDNAPEKAQ